MKILVASFFLCLVMGLTARGQERGWRGLVPLHSTRADVERLLGQPARQLSTLDVFYRTDRETVIISYTNGRPCGIGVKYSQWRIPRDTVQSIRVTPTSPLPFSGLAIDEKRYQKRSGGHLPQDVYYINDEEGVSIRVFMGDVMGISLYPGRIDANKSCFPTVTTDECEGLAPPGDSYGTMSLQQERMELDNFAILLRNSNGATGYIIAYAGKTARVGEATVLAERAKDYLVKVRHVPLDQIKAIDGGFREERTVQLYVVPRNGCPPIPDPTIDPRDVRLVRSPRFGNATPPPR